MKETKATICRGLAIDWADQKHVWSTNSALRERGEVEQTPEAIEAWVANLRSAP